MQYDINTLETIYSTMILEGQLSPNPEEQEAYNRLVTLNNNAGQRDYTDALLQWYRNALKQNNEDISFDKTNHIKDTLKVLNNVLSNKTIKPGATVSVNTSNGIVQKDITNPRQFWTFDMFAASLTNYLNLLQAEEGDAYLTQNDLTECNIKLIKSTSDMVVFSTKTYKDSLAFIRVLWPKMQGTSHLGAYGRSEYDENICPYCTSAKHHWDDYSSGSDYTQYWFLKNLGLELQDYYGKGKEAIYALLDSDGELLNKYDVDFNKYAIHIYPSFSDLIKEIYTLNKTKMDKEQDSIFKVLNAPTREEIKELQEHYISELKNKTINGIYNGNISCNKFFTSLEAFSFIKEVKGNFYCRGNQLESLEGAPSSVSGNFNCRDNELESLEGAPSSVGRFFNCGDNHLKSLEGAPSSVHHFNCCGNQLESLEGAPSSVGGNFDCRDNGLKSLKGAPSSVNGDFVCSRNQLTSLEGAPSSVNGNFNCRDNELESLEGAPSSVNGFFNCSGNPGKFTKEDIINAQKEK